MSASYVSNFLKSGLHIWLYLSINYIEIVKKMFTSTVFSCLGGLEVTRQTAVPDVPCLIPGSDLDVYVCFSVLLFLSVYLLVQIHLLS